MSNVIQVDFRENALSDEERFKEEAEKIYKNSFPRIITVSRLDKRKGHDKILMLIKNLKLALIESSNLFLMPSRIEGKSIEGFGISFVEAASYGVGSIGG